MTSPLLAEIIARIRAEGPMTVEAWMALCLGHAEHGYYRRRQALGAGGDFVTAPEISQIFGELIGLWLAQCWRDQGGPSACLLVELGPGRGVLMADALRAVRRAAPEFFEAARVWLVESSETLRAEQTARLAEHTPRHSADLDALPDGPIYLIANEFFDALPIRQLRRQDGAWRERLVDVVEDRLAFTLGPPLAEDLPGPPEDAWPEGAWLEVSPAAERAARALGARLRRFGGAALMVDYGYTDQERREAGWRETLQAARRHAFADPLARPGETDLTAHVNFDDLRRALGAAAAAHGPISQGSLLRRLSAEARAAALARAAPARAEEIALGLHRLTDPEQMGRLFRAMAATAAGAPTPPGFETG